MNTNPDPFSPAALQNRQAKLEQQLKQSKNLKLLLTISTILYSGISLPTLADAIISASDGNFEKLPAHIAIILFSAVAISFNQYEKRKITKRIENDNLEYLRTWAMIKSPKTIDIYKAVIYKDKQI